MVTRCLLPAAAWAAAHLDVGFNCVLLICKELSVVLCGFHLCFIDLHKAFSTAGTYSIDVDFSIGIMFGFRSREY